MFTAIFRGVGDPNHHDWGKYITDIQQCIYIVYNCNYIYFYA